MTDTKEMERFFGFSMGDTQQTKIKAVKTKIKKVEQAEKKHKKTEKDTRDIEMLEKFGLTTQFINDPERRKKSQAEEDQNVLSTLKKMGVIG